MSHNIDYSNFIDLYLLNSIFDYEKNCNDKPVAIFYDFTTAPSQCEGFGVVEKSISLVVELFRKCHKHCSFLLSSCLLKSI